MEHALAVKGKPTQLVVHETSFARAYVLRGDWVADCPNVFGKTHCGNTEYITDLADRHRGRAGVWGERKPMFHCTYCGLIAEIDWPADASQIEAVLDKRPIPHTRNWYPEGHRTAVLFSIPDGQTAADLELENRQNGVA